MILHIFKILILKKEERGNIYIWRKGACERKRTEIKMCVKKEQVHRSSSTALCWPKAPDSSKKYIYYTLKWSIICNIFLIKRQNTMLLNNHYLGKYISFLQILLHLESLISAIISLNVYLCQITQVYDNSVVFRKCGTLPETNYIILGHKMLVTFVSDGKNTAPGFKLRWKGTQSLFIIIKSLCIRYI